MIMVEFIGGRFDGMTRAFPEPLESIYQIAYPNPETDWAKALDDFPEEGLDLKCEVYTLRAFKTGVGGELQWRYVL